MGKSIRGTRRGMGPSAYARIAEIMSGRATSQQGLATTCEDPAYNETTGGVGREMVWRMSAYERGRRGNALPSGLGDRSDEGNALVGRRGSGHSVATDAEAQPDSELELLRPVLRGEGATRTPRSRGEGCASTPASHRGGRPARKNGVQSRGQDRTREIRPSGIVGGASGNVAHGETRNPRCNRKGGRGNASPVGARAWTLSRHPHAACDEAGAGDGPMVKLVRHSQGKPGAPDRLHLRGTAPAPDPTTGGLPPEPPLESPASSPRCFPLTEIA
jgi:hypothetical protein